MKEFLLGLNEQGLLQFNADSGCGWNEDKIRTQDFTNNVIEHMIKKINRFQKEELSILKIASCIGSVFDLSTLARLSISSKTNVACRLKEAMLQGLIHPLDDHYKYFLEEVTAEVEEEENSILNSNFRFAHDRVREAAYSLLEEKEKKITHLKIGRRLLETNSKENLEDSIFSIVNHFNLSLEFLEKQEEKDKIAHLNYRAGRKARLSTAIEAASQYYHHSLSLLSESSWQTDYTLSINLYMELTECVLAQDELKEADELIQVVIKNARSNLEKAKVYYLQILALFRRNKNLEVINLSRKALSLLGIRFPKNKVIALAMVIELLRNQIKMKRKGISKLYELPETEDEQIILALKILQSITMAGIQYNANFAVVATLIAVRLILKNGTCYISPFNWSSLGGVLQVGLSDYKSAYHLGQLALKLQERYKDISERPATFFNTAAWLNPFTHHIKESEELLIKGYKAGIQSGNFIWSGYCISIYLPFLLIRSAPLVEHILEEIKKYDKFMHGTVDIVSCTLYDCARKFVMKKERK
ncbi:MAG: hypothetical protein KDK45_23670, partial [Leptospiraceae bacterium]|nr:hypothetical protein [Leptospiraceae bacterium]